MYVLRQMTAKLATGQRQSVGDVTVYPYRWIDVPRRMVLQLAGDGRVASENINLIANANYTLALPSKYVAGVSLAGGGKRLRCYFRVLSETVRLTIVSPDEGTSLIQIKATNDAVKGVHDGYLIFTGTITSLSLFAPAAAGNSQIETFLYELPDITTSAAFRDGSLATGVFP